ncbi:MAG: protein-L-isoaspartate(D-aspartate) O-methyltransferase [Ignavibacteriae bacterium]|nr:protein-L-isoaspartate(D-aspartate) O-methyltransferase [Ignavibacteria bacterium]MBI3365611.1 protein-L-isoaspartate(D-aspartate) O-methyltransferase [Ignavibacteriota bacterium]
MVRRIDAERGEMIDVLRQRGITDERLLKAMLSVDRREYVQEAFINRAYEDSALPIGSSQTISQPYTVAFMTQALDVQKGEKVLEIGTGSGYQAAVLAEIDARVFTIERHMDLLTEARKKFDKHRYNIASKCGDGSIGWKEFAPYDGIIVTAGAPDVPQPLLDQLKDGGLLVIPIGNMEVQNLHVIRRCGQHVETNIVAGFKFVPLIGKGGWK